MQADTTQRDQPDTPAVSPVNLDSIFRKAHAFGVIGQRDCGPIALTHHELDACVFEGGR